MSDEQLSKSSPKKIEVPAFLQAEKAQATLESILDEASPDALIERELSTTSVEEGRGGQQIVERESDRVKSRILFITKDPAYLERRNTEARVMEALAPLFDEVHVMVLLPFGGKEDAKRWQSNMWVYRVRARYWWQSPRRALEAAAAQLSFADGFRPDIIVALDPFESGWSALRISKKFKRPYQVHVDVDFFTDRFKDAHKKNKWRVRIAKYVLSRAQGVRTETAQLADVLRARIKHVRDVRVLPQFYNFKSFLDAQPTFDVHERYKDFTYTALAFGPLTADSHLHDTFSALNQTLHNPRIGLIIFGDGPAKQLFEEKVELLGVKKNIIFLPVATDLVSYLTTADVLVQTDTSKESEEVVLKAAAAGLPSVMYTTDLRSDLFTDGDSASLCEEGDVHGIEEGFKALLNNTALRTQYKKFARHVVETRLVEDEDLYYRALRDSIEITLNAENGSQKTQSDSAQLREADAQEGE